MSNEIPAILEPRDEEELAAEFANDQILREAQQAEADAKAAARESALAKLAELGLTEAEIAAL
jgi:DNA-binding NarL/FixJ family response regulator